MYPGAHLQVQHAHAGTVLALVGVTVCLPIPSRLMGDQVFRAGRLCGDRLHGPGGFLTGGWLLQLRLQILYVLAHVFGQGG